MNPIAFVLSTREIFVLGERQVSGPAADAEPQLVRELRQLGWPAEAELLGPQAAALGGRAPGVLIELIDALPLLAAPTDDEGEGPELVAYRRLARLALELVVERAALPRLRARVRGRLGWEARWRAQLCTTAQRAAIARIGAALQPLVAVPAGTSFSARTAALTGQSLAYRMLDACIDMLVREASRRGALVRLGSWPAHAWEQQLVRALGEDRATFFCPESLDAEALSREVNAWVDDQLSATSLSLLQSPAMWAAPESLTQVLRRLLAPAAQLALTLRSGRPAPRMLPAGLPGSLLGKTAAQPAPRIISAAAVQAAARAVAAVAMPVKAAKAA